VALTDPGAVVKTAAERVDAASLDLTQFFAPCHVRIMTVIAHGCCFLLVWGRFARNACLPAQAEIKRWQEWEEFSLDCRFGRSISQPQAILQRKPRST
jgi:hypothetical protein